MKKKRVERIAWLDEDSFLVCGKPITGNECVELDLKNCKFAQEVMTKLKPSMTKKVKIIVEEV